MRIVVDVIDTLRLMPVQCPKVSRGRSSDRIEQLRIGLDSRLECEVGRRRS